MTITRTFKEMKKKNEAALICYYTAGFPNLDASMEQIETMAEGGADIIEIGIPFSDPIADGAVIQHAASAALKQGVCLRSIIDAVSHLSVRVPLVFMSYLNPVLRYGIETFCRDARNAGISGVILPDLPAEESGILAGSARKHSIDPIFMVSPASTEKRINAVCRVSAGFIYCVSLCGVTGMRNSLNPHIGRMVESVASCTDTPVAVGFGIACPSQVAGVSAKADGVVVGSRILDAAGRGEDVKALVRRLKNATKRGALV